MSHWWLAYLVLGAFAGFFAGLLGIGGGAIMVPILAMIFVAQGLPDMHVVHLALATSMAAIIFTSLSSMRAHHHRKAVRWPIVKAMTPGVIFGSLIGTQIAARVSTRPLAIFFAAFMTLVAVQMLCNAKPKAARQLPDTPGLLAVGVGIGSISSLVAIGGGSLIVPFLTWCNIRIHESIGVSAALGFPIALAGTFGYVIAGLGAPYLPAATLGFVHLPALTGLLIASMALAPVGAHVAHRLPVATIKRIFSVVLIALSAKMLYGLFFA